MAEKGNADGRICERIKSLPEFKRAGAVMIYMPIKGEVDVTGLLSEDKIFLTPVTRGDDIYPAKISGETVKGAFSVPEPKDAELFDKEDINIVIVPGIVFGRDFNRIGFGKGYYDRFLKGMDALKIGVCRAFQLVGKIGSEAHDIKMDAVMTEGETLWNRENTSFL